MTIAPASLALISPFSGPTDSTPPTPPHREGTLDREALASYRELPDSYKRERLTLDSLKASGAFPEASYRTRFLLDKVQEEFNEVRDEILDSNPKNLNYEKIHEEMGDMAYSMNRLFLAFGVEDIHPLVNQTLDKVISRLEKVESLNRGRPFSTLSTKQFERFWDQAKVAENALKNGQAVNITA